MASEQVEAGRDDQMQASVGLTQGLLDRLRGFTAGKNEPGVTGALGKGLESSACDHVLEKARSAVTCLRKPARGMGSIMVPAAACSRDREVRGRPQAWRMSSSSRDIPVPKRSERLHKPPMGRAASSRSQGPWPLTRNSACKGP